MAGIVNLQLRATLMCVALGLLACTHQPVDPPIDFRDLEGCLSDAEALACKATLAHARGRDRLLEVVLDACKQGSPESCYWVGRWFAEIGQPARAYRPLELACRYDIESSCSMLIGLTLDRHRWLYECAARAALPPTGEVRLEMTLISGGREAPARVRLDRLVGGERSLSRCIQQAVAHTDFPPIDLYGVDSASLNAGHLAARAG